MYSTTSIFRSDVAAPPDAVETVIVSWQLDVVASGSGEYLIISAWFAPIFLVPIVPANPIGAIKNHTQPMSKNLWIDDIALVSGSMRRNDLGRQCFVGKRRFRFGRLVENDLLHGSKQECHQEAHCSDHEEE